jgi:hypothetical protein
METAMLFERAYPELYWTVSKGRVRCDEPLYGAVITTSGMTDIGEGESNISADDALRIAIENAGLLIPSPAARVED